MKRKKKVKHLNSIESLVQDLYYPSESDEPIELVVWPLAGTEPLTVSQVKQCLMIPPDVLVEESSEAAFWEPVLTEQDWYEAEEKQTVARFRTLKEEIEKQVSERQVFRVGQTEIDVYLLGKKAEGGWAGLKTKVVET